MNKIFVVTHKEDPILQNSIYQPIQVGTNKEIYPGIIRDNTLDNITAKNNNFCELTAAYWIWKNHNTDGFVGICHYRRYFNFFNPIYNLKPSAQKKININTFKKSKLAAISPVLLEKKISNLLVNHDIIIGRAYKMKQSLTANYCQEHRKEDWDLTKTIILEKYPEYANGITEYLDNGLNFHVANMMICSKKIWNEYYTWLFSILFELEKRIIIPKDQYQARVFGFISERLINLYVYHQKFKIKQIPLYKIIDL